MRHPVVHMPDRGGKWYQGKALHILHYTSRRISLSLCCLFHRGREREGEEKRGGARITLISRNSLGF